MSILTCSQRDAFLDKDDLDSSNWHGETITCPTCDGEGIVETSPMCWGWTAEDSCPAGEEFCPECKGSGKVEEPAQLTVVSAEGDEYDPMEDAS